MALALGLSALADRSALAEGCGRGHNCNNKLCRKCAGRGVGTLSYGPPGLYPGFQGFGLGYHPGYGYGGCGLGTGSEGGYPLYGGPGYPSVEPCLRRLGHLVPFPHNPGLGYPTPDHPNFYGMPGELILDERVVTIDTDPLDAPFAGDYGPFSGKRPYAETVFAPYAAAAEVTGSSTGTTPSYAPNATTPGAPGSPAVGEAANVQPTSQTLGLDAEPVTDTDSVGGMKITKIYPGSMAEKAGLQVGDIIRSVNDYPTPDRAHLVWIVAVSLPNYALDIKLRSVTDGKERTVTIKAP
jgi:PDZ domain-containing protein